MHAHYPHKITTVVYKEAEEWEVIYYKAHQTLQAAKLKCDPLLPLSEYLDDQANSHGIGQVRSLIRPMRDFERLIADTEKTYRQHPENSIMQLVGELSVIKLLALQPEKKEIASKIESYAYLTKVSAEIIWDYYS